VCVVVLPLALLAPAGFVQSWRETGSLAHAQGPVLRRLVALGYLIPPHFVYVLVAILIMIGAVALR
jgi:hypothetical protein